MGFPRNGSRIKTSWKVIAVISCCVVCVFIFLTQGSHDERSDAKDVIHVNRVIPHDNNTPQIDKTVFNASLHTSEIDAMLREKYGPIRFSGVKNVNTALTEEEMARYRKCVANSKTDLVKNGSRFWGKEEHIRRTHHTYLSREGAVLMEVGGNKGNDASEFVRLYNPRYIILEPLEEYTGILREKFKNNSRVTVVNLGLGKQDEVVMVKIEGNNACATSKFLGAGGNTPLYVTNATDFMLKLGLGLFDIDLLTMNCEGCEFEALEELLSTNLVEHIKNIQWATHSTIKGLSQPYERYCKIQELLSRTHRPTYQYRFIWESWRRRGVP